MGDGQHFTEKNFLYLKIESTLTQTESSESYLSLATKVVRVGGGKIPEAIIKTVEKNFKVKKITSGNFLVTLDIPKKDINGIYQSNGVKADQLFEMAKSNLPRDSDLVTLTDNTRCQDFNIKTTKIFNTQDTANFPELYLHWRCRHGIYYTTDLSVSPYNFVPF